MGPAMHVILSAMEDCMRISKVIVIMVVILCSYNRKSQFLHGYICLVNCDKLPAWILDNRTYPIPFQEMLKFSKVRTT